MPYIATTPEHFVGKKIGDGGPLAFVQRALHPPAPSTWRQGRRVMSLERHDIPKGTLIMAFGAGHEMRHGPNLPVAIYMGHDGENLYVIDQHKQHAVGPRIIHLGDHPNPADNAGDYHIVE